MDERIALFQAGWYLAMLRVGDQITHLVEKAPQQYDAKAVNAVLTFATALAEFCAHTAPPFSEMGESRKED